jgi:serine/threonine protein phosphatase 1
MKRYVIGDIHGGFLPLQQVLEKVNFDYHNDLLICLGDVVDGWSEIQECFDLLLTIKNLIYIKGNHEQWALDYYTNKLTEATANSWRLQGGQSTIDSLGDRDKIDSKYIKFMQSSVLHYELIEQHNKRLFIHAGIPETLCFPVNGHYPSLNSIDPKPYLWDRKMVMEAYQLANEPYFSWGDRYDEIYVGHSPTIRFNVFYSDPQHWGNIWLMDTGAATKGKLSIMNIDTQQIAQSDYCDKIYPNQKGRNQKSYNEGGI